jgi:hypothetical protein
MTITLTDGTTTSTLIAGATRAVQSICGPVDEQSLDDQLQTQIKMPLRAIAATPLPRGNLVTTFRFSGIWLDNSEDLAREWAFTWPSLCLRSGTLYIKGTTRRVVGANAVINAITTRNFGASSHVSYTIICGAVTAENY